VGGIVAHRFVSFFTMAEKKKKIDDAKNQAEDAPVVPRVRIKIRAYDNKVIDVATKTIIDTAERNNAKVVGPVPLPTEKSKYSVNRSTFISKTSQEQFEMRIHKRLVDIISPTPKAVDALMNLNLPSGIDLAIKMI
jgi:small subunit ribosomal protein S10